jgi:putative transposase
MRPRIAADSVMAIPARNSNPIQIVSGVRTFHVSSSTSGKRFLFQSERAARLFLRVLQEYRAQGRFLLHEFVVMPDHFHVLLTVKADTTVERAVQFIKGGFAFRAGKELGLKAPIWQRGFSEVRVLNARAASGICEYIRDNPVVAGMVQRASDYPYSSAYPGCILDSLPQGLKPVSFKKLLRHG